MKHDTLDEARCVRNKGTNATQMLDWANLIGLGLRLGLAALISYTVTINHSVE